MATQPSQMKPPAPAISVLTCCSGLPHQEQRFSALGNPRTVLGSSVQPAMEAGNPAKGKPAQAPEHGEVEDHKAHGCRDFDHGHQIVDPSGLDRWSCCARPVRQSALGAGQHSADGQEMYGPITARS